MKFEKYIQLTGETRQSGERRGVEPLREDFSQMIHIHAQGRRTVDAHRGMGESYEARCGLILGMGVAVALQLSSVDR